MLFNLDEIITITVTLFAIIDVVGAVPVLISMKSRLGEIESGKATLASGLLMILFLIFGTRLLGVLGVDINSFAVAGSIVIFIMGLEMVLGIELFRQDPDVKSGSIIPIAFPIIAGSGTLTTVMSLRANFSVYNILIGILINLIAVYLVLRSINYLERKLGKSGLFVIRKFFGVILLAISIKIFKANIGL
ncbi:MAG TPA: MarC family protein [Flavobacteriales bacterium]|jgi:multiple antibiotic resistance protein|nr:MarC family protein [Flavobacteriales bacterium]HPH82626.1 MarC family protein [Flavobacteriales bacterium]